MFEQIFKNIDEILRNDAGCSSELDYVEQTSWILFLKYIDDLEKEKKISAELSGKKYTSIINPEFQWNTWAVPKDNGGRLDHHKALTGDDLTDFVNQKLFPYFKKFKANAEAPDTIEYKIGEIFSELKNRIQSGYNLREVINLIDGLKFGSSAEKHEMSHLYESKIQNMGNAGRNGGEYYTPRPLIKTIVKVVNPKIGDKIYDGAVGSAGFLCEAYGYLKDSKSLTTKDIETLQKDTFYGKEKKPLAYIIGIMNMIFHGINSPNIIHTNTLSENIIDIQEKDRYDVVLANPPFGGNERAEVQQNFPIKTGETALLFLQHFIKILKANGKAGIVIKNTFLSNPDNASVSLRKYLLESCNLHTILSLPTKVFQAGGETIVLFFEKGVSTKNIWYYQLNLDRNLGKTNPLNENDLVDFIKLQKTKANSDNSWTINVSDINTATYDLSVKNPNIKKIVNLREPKEIINEIITLDEKSISVIKSIETFESYLFNVFANKKNKWANKPLIKIGKLFNGNSINEKIKKEKYTNINLGLPYIATKDISFDYEINYETGVKIPEDDLINFKIAHKNSVLICSEGGSAGRKLAFNIKDICFVNKLIVLEPFDFMNPKFIYYFYQSESFKNQFKSKMNGLIGGVSIGKFKTINIVVPSLPEQNEIVKKLDEFYIETKKLKIIYETKISYLEELKKSILEKAFKGELIKDIYE